MSKNVMVNHGWTNERMENTKQIFLTGLKNFLEEEKLNWHIALSVKKLIRIKLSLLLIFISMGKTIAAVGKVGLNGIEDFEFFRR